MGNSDSYTTHTNVNNCHCIGLYWFSCFHELVYDYPDLYSCQCERTLKNRVTLYKWLSFVFFCNFLQRGRIACNAERCNTYSNSVCLSVRPSVRPSVCPSVTRWYPIQTNEHRITRSSLWGSKNTLVFWYQQWLGGDDPFHLKFALKVTHSPLKCAEFDPYLLITSQP